MLPSAKAEKHCLKLMDILEDKKRLDFETSPQNDNEADPRLSTEALFGEARGQMFGILLCARETNLEGNPDTVILKAFSGQFNGVWEIPGWAPPLLDPAEFESAVLRADPPIKALTSEINALPQELEERSALIEKRRMLSQRHMQEIHSMYTIRNFASGSTDLFSLFEGRPGIPAGTGDCCAPKLLNQAVLLGLKPLSMAEFYWGRTNRSGTKQHRRFYPPCSDKCMPMLAYMLRGVQPEDAADA